MMNEGCPARETEANAPPRLFIIHHFPGGQVMMRWKQVFAAIFVLGLGQAHASAEPGKPGEQMLIRGMEAFRPGGALAASMGHFSTVQVTGQSFEEAVCAQTEGSPANRWDLMLQAPVESALSQ